MKHKDIKIQLKSVSEKGEFEGYAAIFNNVDLGGDMIMPGAFSKTMKENVQVPVLWGHSSREVIGLNQDWSEDSKGLHVKGKLILDVQRAVEAHALMKEGAVKGLSIGYDAIIADYRQEKDDFIRVLREIKVWEYSLVPFPMNPDAQLTDVKSAGEIEETLHQAIRLSKRFAGQLSAEQKALIEQAIKQLSALQAAKAPEAAMLEKAAPDLHASFDRLSSILT